jgi:hypothetical protein
VWASSATTLKFNGRYAIFSPKEKCYFNLKIPGGGVESYSATLPSVTVHNLVIGKTYIDIVGKSLITNDHT